MKGDAALALVWPVASWASEFPGMNAAYAQRLKRDRAISSLWLAPQALQSTVPPSALAGGLSEAQETPVPPLNTYHLSLNTNLTPIPNWSTRGAYEDWVHIDLPETFRVAGTSMYCVKGKMKNLRLEAVSDRKR